MNSFNARFCNPFLRDIIEYGPTEKLEVINLFVTTAWARLNYDIYERQAEVIHDFYYFEVTYTDTGGLSHTLNIAPEYNPGKHVTAASLRFTIRFVRPKMRKRLLGLAGSKLDKAYLTEREGNDESFVINNLIAFMDGDEEFLDKQIIQRTSLQDD